MIFTTEKNVVKNLYQIQLCLRVLENAVKANHLLKPNKSNRKKEHFELFFIYISPKRGLEVQVNLNIFMECSSGHFSFKW